MRVPGEALQIKDAPRHDRGQAFDKQFAARVDEHFGPGDNGRVGPTMG